MPLVSVVHDENCFGDAGPGRERPPEGAVLHAPPEFFELRKTVLDLVAGDEARIDGADRGADQPVGLDARLVQRLIDTALIGAKRTSALQHEHDLAVIVVADLVDRFERGKTLGRRHGRAYHALQPCRPTQRASCGRSECPREVKSYRRYHSWKLL